MAVFNLQQRLHEISKMILNRFFTTEEADEIGDFIITVGHFNREHGNGIASWVLQDEIELAEIFIDSQAFNKGADYIVSIIHHGLVMLLLKGAGNGSFDSRTKAFRDAAKAHGLEVFETYDRFKFRTAKIIEEHNEAWREFYMSILETTAVKSLLVIKAVTYPDLVSKRMLAKFEKDVEEGTLYPLPGGLLKPGTGGRAKKDHKFVRVKVTKSTLENEVVDEAKTQYYKIRDLLTDPDDKELGLEGLD